MTLELAVRTVGGLLQLTILASWPWGIVAGTSLGHGLPDNGGHQRIPAANSTSGLTSANAQDQQS
jgi:hypothetical protein